MTPAMNRRRFVWLCLGSAASVSLILSGCDGGVEAEAGPVTPATTSDEAQPAATPASQQRFVSRCPRGLINDPYPGRCRRYVDKSGDGICDLSQQV